jgi:hypothetical protein
MEQIFSMLLLLSFFGFIAFIWAKEFRRAAGENSAQNSTLAPPAGVTVSALIDGASLLVLGGVVAWILLRAIPHASAIGANIANDRGPAQFGGALLSIVSPVLPFIGIAALMYWVARIRKTEPVHVLLWTAILLAGVLILPLSKTVLPALGAEFRFVGLRRWPIGFAIFYFTLGFGVIYGTYKQMTSLVPPSAAE